MIQVKEIPQVVLEGPLQRTFVYQVPLDTFTHSNPDAKLRYSATMEDGRPLEAWLDFDSKQLQFMGTVPSNVVNTVKVIVKAFDQFGSEASTPLTLVFK